MKMGKHSWLMMAGCGVMLVGVFILPMLGVRLRGVLPILLALACPLSMVFMMGSMGKGHDHFGRSAAGHGEGDQEEAHGAHCHEEKAPRALPAPRDQN
jgi:hypothetical protein